MNDESCGQQSASVGLDTLIEIAQKFGNLREYIMTVVPPSRYRSIIVTKLEEAELYTEKGHKATSVKAPVDMQGAIQSPSEVGAEEVAPCCQVNTSDASKEALGESIPPKKCCGQI